MWGWFPHDERNAQDRTSTRLSATICVLLDSAQPISTYNWTTRWFTGSPREVGSRDRSYRYTAVLSSWKYVRNKQTFTNKCLKGFSHPIRALPVESQHPNRKRHPFVKYRSINCIGWRIAGINHWSSFSPTKGHCQRALVNLVGRVVPFIRYRDNNRIGIQI